MQKIMKVLRVRGMSEDIEVAVTLAMSYLVYYVTNAPLHLSGVTAVVVFGLYGSATLKVRRTASPASFHLCPTPPAPSASVCAAALAPDACSSIPAGLQEHDEEPWGCRRASCPACRVHS